MQLDVFVMSFFALRFERKIPDPKKSLQNVKLALSLIQWRLEQLLLHLREKRPCAINMSKEIGGRNMKVPHLLRAALPAWGSWLLPERSSAVGCK